MVPALFLLYINDLPQAVASNPLLYADDTCIVVQHKGVIEFEKQLIKVFQVCVTGLLIINLHFRQYKTNLISFGTKHKLPNAKSFKYCLLIKVKNIECTLDECLLGKSIVLNVIDKVNSEVP